MLCPECGVSNLQWRVRAEEAEAALAAREEPSVDLTEKVARAIHRRHCMPGPWEGLQSGDREEYLADARVAIDAAGAAREEPQSVQLGGLTRIRELANDLYYHAEEAGADLDEIKPIVEEIGGILLSIQLSTRACEDTGRPDDYDV